MPSASPTELSCTVAGICTRFAREIRQVSGLEPDSPIYTAEAWAYVSSLLYAPSTVRPHLLEVLITGTHTTGCTYSRHGLTLHVSFGPWNHQVVCIASDGAHSVPVSWMPAQLEPGEPPGPFAIDLIAGHGPTEVSSSTVIAPAVTTTIALGYRPVRSVSALSSIDEVTDLLSAHDNSHLFPPEHGHLRLGPTLSPIVHAIAALRPRGTAGIDITAIF